MNALEEAQPARSSFSAVRSKWRAALPWIVAGLLASFVGLEKGQVLYKSWGAEHSLKGQGVYVTDIIHGIRFVPSEGPATLYTAAVEETFYGDERPGRLLIAKLSPTVELWIAWRKEGDELCSANLFAKGRSVLHVSGRDGAFPTGFGMTPLTGPDLGSELMDGDWDGNYDLKVPLSGKSNGGGPATD